MDGPLCAVEPVARPDVISSGAGLVELAVVAGATAVVRRRATSPLKLLTPRSMNGVAHVVASTYGGGLLAGDEVGLTVNAGPGTRCTLGTQASTKVYRSENERVSRQSLEADVGPGAILAVAPDPVTCFAGARYEQRQRFRLASDASLLLVDWLTSGRAARGERWALDRCRTDTRIHAGAAGERTGDRCIARDALLLDVADGPIGAPHRTGRFDCLSTVFLVGPAFEPAAAALLARVAKLPVPRRAPLAAAASPVRGGAMLRVAGPGAEAVGRFLAAFLAPAWAALGDDPWSRKW